MDCMGLKEEPDESKRKKVTCIHKTDEWKEERVDG